MTYPLSAQIRNKRKEQGWTIESLAYQISCSPNQIWRLENGKNVGLETIQKIVEGLHLELIVFPVNSATTTLP